MKTVIFVNPKRVDKYKKWCEIPEGMDLIFFDQKAGDDEVLKSAGDADFIFADVIKAVSARLIESMSNLKLIHSEGVGYNRIDTEAAKRANVYVCNNPGVNSGAVAEQAILLMLALLRDLLDGDNKVRIGRQINAKEEKILNGIKELHDCHVGLVGFGAIAKETAKRLSAFGCRMSYFSRTKKSEAEEKEFGVSYLTIDELLGTCDIVSLHAPVTPETMNMVDTAFLAKMKPEALLINTARGELVDQEALKQALIDNKIGGAGLDTLTPEPVTLENPLLNLPEPAAGRVVFSPHIGGTTEGAFRKMHQGVWGNIKRVINGEKPLNIVKELQEGNQ